MAALANKYLRDTILSLVRVLSLTVVCFVLPLNAEMCATLISTDGRENISALQTSAFSSFRSTCREKSPLHLCKYLTEPANPHTFIFIMGPLTMPFKLDFSVMSETGAIVGLAGTKSISSIFAEITIGGWRNSASAVRTCYSNTCTEQFAKHYESVLDEDEYRPFWIEYTEGIVTVGKGGQREAFIWWDAGAYHGRVTSEVYVGISGAKNSPDSWDFNTKYVCEKMQNR